MRLFFVVLAKPLGESSAVHITKENNVIGGKTFREDELAVFELKKMIWEELNGNEKGSNETNQWTLWKVENFIEGGEKWVALENIEDNNTENYIKNELKGNKLTSAMSLKNHAFPSDPPEGMIHIIVGTGKRPLGDSDEGQNSKRAKLADPSISTACKIIEKIMKLSDDLEYYSNPKNLFPLPFPYPGEKRPMDRFNIDSDGYFNFMGRKKFMNVLKTIEELRAGGYMKLLVYGTAGYGKSHILSATACFLIRKGKRVVYLPDCRQLSVDQIDYVKSALFLTYHDDDAKIEEINPCENFENIISFCKNLRFEEKLYFIVDQMNALDERDDTGISIEIKQQIRRDIDKMANSHFYIMSSSANKTILHLMTKQTNELRIKLFGGFDKEEMKEWWNKHNPDLPNQQKEQIEDVTGKVPLFLSFLLKSSHKDFEDALIYLRQNLFSIVQNKMVTYSNNILSKNNETIMNRHVDLMSSSLTNSYRKLDSVDDDYDPRYFYVDGNKCYYICGFVRDLMAEYLMEQERMEIFVDIGLDA